MYRTAAEEEEGRRRFRLREMSFSVSEASVGGWAGGTVESGVSVSDP